jgi:hypothetical protein
MQLVGWDLSDNANADPKDHAKVHLKKQCVLPSADFVVLAQPTGGGAGSAQLDTPITSHKTLMANAIRTSTTSNLWLPIVVKKSLIDSVSLRTSFLQIYNNWQS